MQNSFVADRTLAQALEKRSISVPCLKARMLFKQGESPMGLYILKSGKASLVMKGENGAEVMHLTIGPGSILGVPAVVSKEPYTLSATAFVGSEVSFVETSDFEDLMQSEPSLFPLVLAVLAAEVRSARVAFTGIITRFKERHSRTEGPALHR